MLEDPAALAETTAAFAPDVVVYLAAQAGPRSSLEAPRAYLAGNVDGMFHVIESAQAADLRNLLVASTSSIYGASAEVPFAEMQKATCRRRSTRPPRRRARC